MARGVGFTWLVAGLLSACGPATAEPDACEVAGVDALSTCLTPTQEDAFYVEQALLYFDTMDRRVELEVFPAYSELVVRWEWPPWLKLTGFGREGMEVGDRLLRLYPSVVEDRDCRAFAEQPFARCYVTFLYDAHEGRPCPIYEEFTFNDAGETTFIEAWSDQPGMSPATPDDPWAERADAARLSTRVPGLGGPEGRIDLDGDAMRAAAAADPDLADLVVRAEDFFGTWSAELAASGDALWEEGCGW